MYVLTPATAFHLSCTVPSPVWVAAKPCGSFAAGGVVVVLVPGMAAGVSPEGVAPAKTPLFRRGLPGGIAAVGCVVLGVVVVGAVGVGVGAVGTAGTLAVIVGAGVPMGVVWPSPVLVALVSPAPAVEPAAPARQRQHRTARCTTHCRLNRVAA